MRILTQWCGYNLRCSVGICTVEVLVESMPGGVWCGGICVYVCVCVYLCVYVYMCVCVQNIITLMHTAVDDRIAVR